MLNEKMSSWGIFFLFAHREQIKSNRIGKSVYRICNAILSTGGRSKLAESLQIDGN